jgi:hypothetical protein
LKTIFTLLLIGAAPVLAATPALVLGTDYSEWAPPSISQVATDAAGAVYLLTSYTLTGSSTQPSMVTKLSPDGKTIVWQNQLAFPASAMAVDPNGGVYVLQSQFTGNGSPLSVVKLGPAGNGLAWTEPTGINSFSSPAMAADSSGRVYVAAGIPRAGRNAGACQRIRDSN